MFQLKSAIYFTKHSFQYTPFIALETLNKIAMPVPTVTLMAPEPSLESKAQSLKVPEVSIRSVDSDVSDDDSVLRCEIDSLPSGSESDSDVSERHLDVSKKAIHEETDTVIIPTPETVQPALAQREEQVKSDEDVEVAYDGKKPPAPRSVAETCEDIVGVLARYRLVHQSDTNKPWGAKSKFLHQVEKFVAKQEPVLLSLPAFPFKSPNKATKVLGTLPDKGEEVAIFHLQGLCLAIKDVYEHGADVYIVSDGLMYNGKRCSQSC